MTFIVNQDGIVYRRDLNKKTEALGKVMQDSTPIQLGTGRKRKVSNGPAIRCQEQPERNRY
jgi:hypothetical protein